METREEADAELRSVVIRAAITHGIITDDELVTDIVVAGIAQDADGSHSFELIPGAIPIHRVIGALRASQLSVESDLMRPTDDD